jgi:hypothetical protein
VSLLQEDRVMSTRPAVKGMVFRRTGDALTATVACEGATHRVVIASDGSSTYLDHNERVLLGMRALGNTEVIPCQSVRAATEAAQHWLDRRLRQDAPDGYFGNATLRWSSRETHACCAKHQTKWTSNPAAPTNKVRHGMAVDPGGLLNHSRSVEHLAFVHRANVSSVKRIAAFLAERSQVSMNTRDLPSTALAAIRALVPAEVTDDQVGNLWTLGVTLPFLQVVHDIYPTAEEAVGTAPEYARSWYLRFYRHVLDWWYAGVDEHWLREIGMHARAHWPHRRDGYGYDSWLNAVLAWHAGPLDAATVGNYLAAGVRSGLVVLARQSIDPVVAAEFEVLTSHPAEDRRGTSLSDWLSQGYTVDTAMSVVRIEPHASPVWDNLRQGLNRESSAALAALGDADAARALASPESMQRLLAVGALVQTPARSVRWWQTGLPLDVIASSLAEKRSPAEAVRRAARG